MSNFKDLGLSEPTLQILEKLGFEQPTPIQEKAIPLLLTKDPTDFIGLAQTGTGKTAAFGLPLIELIDEDQPHVQAIVMAPTRELGQQTAQQLESFTSNRKKLNVEVVYGGANIVPQIKALKKPTQIIVATPGRLIDLISRKAVNLKKVEYVILDEADEMLNMGFQEPIDEILSHTLDHRVTWLFSATMPNEIRRIIKQYMVAPEEVAVNTKQQSNKDIAHQYVVTKTANKLPALRRFLDLQPDMRGIMFCRTKRETQQITDELTNLGYGVEALHGDLSQAQRDAAMRRFKSRSMQLLIATDVAARGIDVNDLTHVFNHTLPDQLESYTHRSGRTGRAGKKGVSLAFINPREGRKISHLESKLKVTFEKVEVPSVDDLKASRINNWANLILNTKVDENAEELLQSLQGQLKELSKDELIKRLITTQLDHLMVQSGGNEDLNETQGKPKKQREESNNSGENRYFVNVGTIDGLTKGDLVHFLADIAQVKRKSFGEVILKKNCAYFYIDKQVDSGISKKFEGIEIDGRAIRVNRDDEGNKPKSSGKSKGSPHKGKARRAGQRDFKRSRKRRR
ncbi:MAG: DEAD/DEAH box helicase [bacterium]|nr:DEAD/DEAH box helicase [bacterium]